MRRPRARISRPAAARTICSPGPNNRPVLEQRSADPAVSRRKKVNALALKRTVCISLPTAATGGRTKQVLTETNSKAAGKRGWVCRFVWRWRNSAPALAAAPSSAAARFTSVKIRPSARRWFTPPKAARRWSRPPASGAASFGGPPGGPPARPRRPPSPRAPTRRPRPVRGQCPSRLPRFHNNIRSPPLPAADRAAN